HLDEEEAQRDVAGAEHVDDEIDRRIFVPEPGRPEQRAAVAAPHGPREDRLRHEFGEPTDLIARQRRHRLPKFPARSWCDETLPAAARAVSLDKPTPTPPPPPPPRNMVRKPSSLTLSTGPWNEAVRAAAVRAPSMARALLRASVEMRRTAPKERRRPSGSVT